MEFKLEGKWWWTLISEECGQCCDNEEMADQIEILKYDEIKEWQRLNLAPHSSNG